MRQMNVLGVLGEPVRKTFGAHLSIPSGPRNLSSRFCLFELADAGGLLQIAVVKRGCSVQIDIHIDLLVHLGTRSLPFFFPRPDAFRKPFLFEGWTCAVKPSVRKVPESIRHPEHKQQSRIRPYGHPSSFHEAHHSSLSNGY
jgi:hypothetical protein